MNNTNLTKTLDQILQENNTIAVHETAQNWKEAIQKVVALLVKANLATPDYADAIIQATEELGPYYLIADNVAMPHTSPGPYNLANGFSLLTLKEPVDFGGVPIQVLICLGATTGDFHVATALPQIAALFDDLDMGNKIAACHTPEEIYNLIANINFSKYLN